MMEKKIFIKNTEGKKVNLDKVKDIELLREEVRDFKSKHINTININYPTKSEMERVRFLISLVYEAKVFNNDTPIARKVTEKYKHALAIYIVYGYNTEAKEIVKESLGLKNDAQINTLNSELRERGLMVLDKRNQRISHLCDEFKYLSKFVQKYKSSNEISIRFVA